MAGQDKVMPKTVTSKESASKLLEQRYVYGVYQQMSGYFRHQHYNIWPNVEQFLAGLPLGSIVADVGCGNGKYLGVNDGTFMLGADICAELVEIAGSRVGNEVLTCDNLCLPYRDGVFDAVISIGVIHHLTSAKRRRQAVKELCRVLRPGGKLMICVWAFEQKHRKFGSQDVLIPWCNNDGRIPINGKARVDHCNVYDNFPAKKRNSISVTSDSNPPNNRSPLLRENEVNSNHAINDETKNASNHFHLSRNEINSPGSLLQSAGNHVLSFVSKKVLRLFGDKFIDKYSDLNNVKVSQRDFVGARKRPEHSASCDDEVFAVREFPQSSWPKKVVEKQSSFDSASLRNTKYSLYLDSLASSSLSTTGFDRTTEVFSGFDQRGSTVSSKNSREPGMRRILTAHEISEIDANAPNIEDIGNIAQLDSCSSTNTGLIDHPRIDRDTINTSNIRLNDQTQKSTSNQSSSNLTFKQFKASYHNRMVRQSVPAYNEEFIRDESGQKATPSRVLKSGRALRVRTLSGSQTVLHGRNGLNRDVDLSSAIMRDKSACVKGFTRKLSTSSIVDSNATHASIACDSEFMLTKMMSSLDAAGAVATYPEGCDYLNQDSCLRFYHVFADGELVALIRRHVPELCIVDARYEHANWCVVAQKL